MDWPRTTVAVSKNVRVSSVCNHSFAYACHVAKSKIMSRMVVLWDSGKRVSNTGRAHYITRISVYDIQ